MCGENHERRTDDIEALSEWLGSLQITNKTLNKTTEQSDEEMSVAIALVTTNMNRQAVMPKSMVLDVMGCFGH